MTHPHIQFEATEHCHSFCLELEMHIRNCRDRQMAANPVFKTTEPEKDRRTVKLKFGIRRRSTDVR